MPSIQSSFSSDRPFLAAVGPIRPTSPPPPPAFDPDPDPGPEPTDPSPEPTDPTDLGVHSSPAAAPTAPPFVPAHSVPSPLTNLSATGVPTASPKTMLSRAPPPPTPTPTTSPKLVLPTLNSIALSGLAVASPPTPPGIDAGTTAVAAKISTAPDP
ncbi:hypothetical protein LTS18_005970, partial [Coniosporium uncinatum]